MNGGIIVLITILLLIIFTIYVLDHNYEKHKWCIMVIFKNEHIYLEEWIKHHIKQGVSHIYMYCNDAKLFNYPFLDKYSKYITIIPWVNKTNNGGQTIQRQAYTHCIKNYNNLYEYLLMLDVDEFIISTKPDNKVIDVINSLDVYNTKAIKVMRFNYGSNGHLKKPDGDVVNNYIKHEKTCSSYKTIANSRYIDTDRHFYGVHDFPLLDKKGEVYNKEFTYAHTGYPNSCKDNQKNTVPLVINHYYTKSYEEYLKRCKVWEGGGVNNIGYRNNCESKFTTADKNEITGFDYL